MPRGRPKNTETRRAQIVEGLLEVIASQGYEGATIPAIADAAGIAAGGVHYHFKTKEHVLLALTERLVADLAARYERRLATATDPCARLDAFINAHLALGSDADPRAVAAWVAIAAESVRRPAVREAYAAALHSRLKALRELCAECLRARQGSAQGAAALAAGILAAIEGAYTVAAAAPDAIPRGSAASTVRRMAHASIPD
ncbi:MAG: TetR family transcriptional regulator C-terminal domain-containing protein [Myxococcota bacterium]